MTLVKPAHLIEKLDLWAMLGALTLLYFTDFFITARYIDIVGIHGEANPLMHSVIAANGLVGLFVAKMAACAFMGLCVHIVKRESYRWFYIALLLLNVLLAVTIIYSLFCLLSAL